jgi:hypothetical protein
VSSAARSRLGDWSATGWRAGCPATATIVCGSSASMTVWPASLRTTTLQGSSSPILRSAASARCASGGLQAPRMRAAGTRRLYRLNPTAVAALRDQLDAFWQRALASYVNVAEQATEDSP